MDAGRRVALKKEQAGAKNFKAAGEAKRGQRSAQEVPSPSNAERAGAWTIGEVHHKLRLDRALKVLLGGASEKFIDRALRAGCVSHNGRVVRVDQGDKIYVKDGDKVTLRRLAPSAIHELPDAEWRVRLLFEDEHLMVIDKPSGLSSAPTPSEPYNAVSALEEFIARRDGKPTTLRNVHRLDKETSGVLIMAKSAAVAAALGAQFKGNQVQKTYWAVLEGLLEGPDSGLWSDRHDVDSNNHAFILPADAEEGKTAKTRFEVIERIAQATVVELRPTTGRMHQLRAQSAFRRAPVAGDNRYGEPGVQSGPVKAPRLSLHCCALAFAHPVEAGRVLELRAGVPTELAGYLEDLRAAEAGPARRKALPPHEEVLQRAIRAAEAARVAAAAAWVAPP